MLDCSDHSPVFATFSLTISADDSDAELVSYIEAAQARLGYGADAGADGVPGADEGAYSPGGGGAGNAGTMTAYGGSGGGGMRGGPLEVPSALFHALHPSQRPLVVQLRVANIAVESRGAMRPPRAVSVLFPLPYEDSSELPERAKIVRQGGKSNSMFAQRSESRASISGAVKTLVSQAGKLEGLHLLLKVSLEDGAKGQCVVCMRDGGFVGAGSHVNMFLMPLTSNGLPLRSPSGSQLHVQFVLEMTAFPHGGVQTVMGEEAPLAAPAMSPPGGSVYGGSGGGGGRNGQLRGGPYDGLAESVGGGGGGTARSGALTGRSGADYYSPSVAGSVAGGAFGGGGGAMRRGPAAAAPAGGYGGRNVRRGSGVSEAAAAQASAAYAHAAAAAGFSASAAASRAPYAPSATAAAAAAAGSLSARSTASSVMLDPVGGGGYGGGGAAAARSPAPTPVGSADPRQRVVALMAAAKARAEAQARLFGPGAAGGGRPAAVGSLLPPAQLGGGAYRPAARV